MLHLLHLLQSTAPRASVCSGTMQAGAPVAAFNRCTMHSHTGNNMLYKFKSRSTADLILLEPQGRRLLQIVGKEPGPTGIITVAQIPSAIEALETAVVAEERQVAAQQEAAAAARQEHKEEQDKDDDNNGDDAKRSEFVSLRQRAAPFIDMLRRSAEGGHDVVWGA